MYLVSDNSQLALLCIWALLQHIVDKSKELLHDCVLPHVIIARLDLQATTQHACCYMFWIMCSSIITAAGMLLACENYVSCKCEQAQKQRAAVLSADAS